MSDRPHFRLDVLAPPYETLTPTDTDLSAIGPFDKRLGTALIWHMNGDRPSSEVIESIRGRPGGVALIVLLPRTIDLTRDPELIRAVGHCRPHGILPFHGEPEVDDLAQVLRRPPTDLSAAVTDYMRWRGIRPDSDTVHLIRRTIDLSGEVRSITALSRSVYLSRRALGRRFLSRGLPVPSHWLQFGRLLRVVTRLQNRNESVFSIACELGYPDGFSVSNQMQRLVGVRPSQARDCLGWEWFAEAWLRREAETGGLLPSLGMTVAPPPSVSSAPSRSQEKKGRVEDRRAG